MADETSTAESNVLAVDAHADWVTRERMAFVALFAMIGVTAGLFFINDPHKLEQLAVAMSWFYGGMASIVAAFIGFKTWGGIKGK